MSVRDRVLPLLRNVVPSTWGDLAFADIVDGNYEPGYGTTCGYLCHWLLWQLGCRNSEIVNREDRLRGLTSYHVGENISRLVNGAKRWNAWHDGPEGIQIGDLFLLSNGPPETEHVAVYLANGGGTWKSADAGQETWRGGQLVQCAKFVERKLDGSRLLTVNGWKAIVGYVRLDAVFPVDPKPVFAIAALALAAAGAVGWLILRRH